MLLVLIVWSMLLVLIALPMLLALIALIALLVMLGGQVSWGNMLWVVITHEV